MLLYIVPLYIDTLGIIEGEVICMAPRQQCLFIKVKGGKYNEISKFGNMFSGCLGGSEFVR